MRLDVVPARSFDGSSRVSTYWLAHCEGFRVRSGRRRGVVLDVAVGEVGGRPEYLVVRFGLVGRAVVAVDEVETVVPADGLLLLRPPQRRPRRLAPAARRARNGAGRAARSGGRNSVRAARTTARTTHRLASAIARETRRLARWLAPRAIVASRSAARAAGAATVWTALALAACARLLRAEGGTAARALVAAARQLRAPEAAARPEEESSRASSGTPSSSLQAK